MPFQQPSALTHRSTDNLHMYILMHIQRLPTIQEHCKRSISEHYQVRLSGKLLSQFVTTAFQTFVSGHVPVTKIYTDHLYNNHYQFLIRHNTAPSLAKNGGIQSYFRVVQQTPFHQQIYWLMLNKITEISSLHGHANCSEVKNKSSSNMSKFCVQRVSPTVNIQ